LNPNLSWIKKTGPGEKIFIKRAAIMNRGDKRNIKIRDSVMSSTLLIRTGKSINVPGE
jgi:hypothetical protein